MKKILTATSMCFMLLLFGCSGANFSCMDKVELKGVKCEPPSSVYEQILSGGELTSSKEKDKKSKEKTQTSFAVAESIGERVVRQLNYDGPEKPIRIPPKIIRIWIAPWEDEHGDLHRGEEVFSEITPTKGRWLFGGKVENYGIEIKRAELTDVLPQKVTEDSKKGSSVKERETPATKKEPKTPVIKKSEE